MIIARIADAPTFADENIDYTAKFLALIKSSPDYQKWFDEPDKIIGFVKEFSSSRNSEGMYSLWRLSDKIIFREIFWSLNAETHPVFDEEFLF